MTAAGWALLVGDRRAAQRWVQSGSLHHPVSSICGDARQALTLLGVGLVDGVMLLDFGQLAGLVEQIRHPGDQTGQRRAQRLYPGGTWQPRPEVTWTPGTEFRT